MIYLLALFVFIGIATTVSVLYVLLKECYQTYLKQLLHIHKHSYQIRYITSSYNQDRNCEEWIITFKCENCNKYKDVKFWNDRLKLKIIVDGDANE